MTLFSITEVWSTPNASWECQNPMLVSIWKTVRIGKLERVKKNVIRSLLWPHNDTCSDPSGAAYIWVRCVASRCHTLSSGEVLSHPVTKQQRKEEQNAAWPVKSSLCCTVIVRDACLLLFDLEHNYNAWWYNVWLHVAWRRYLFGWRRYYVVQCWVRTKRLLVFCLGR